ncbi:MAG: hypothetical protein ABFD94_01975 [Armatimonadia bacterium]
MRCLYLILAALTLTAAGAQNEKSQSIGAIKWETPNYRLQVYSPGHFAVNVGGSWLPGCICLNVNGVPQYKQEALSYLNATVSPLPDGRKIVIAGRLTPDVAFTETILAEPQGLSLTYAAEALRDLPKADIRITAGPQLANLKGFTFEIEGADAAQQYVFPPAAPVTIPGAKSIVWRNVGMRDARTVFVKALQSSVKISADSALYTAILQDGKPLKQGERVEATMRFEAIPLGDAASWVKSVYGTLPLSRFGVSGTGGVVYNLRTDQGLLIQQLSLNEDDVHQVQVGKGKSRAWGGLHLAKSTPGAEYAVEGQGPIVNDWQERLDARSASPTRDEYHFTAHRTLAQGARRLRLLMYVAQWLEQERVPYFIRTPDSAVKRDDGGLPLYFGMPPRETESGLGPYRKLGLFPAGTEIVVPMLSRGEQMTIRLNQPLEVSSYRFEIYFRGLWFQAPDPKTKDMDLTIRVDKLPARHVGTVDVAEDPVNGAFALRTGGMPILNDVTLRQDGKPVPAQWKWSEEPEGVCGEAQLTAPTTLTMRLPEHLCGRALTVTGTQKAPLRLGSDLPEIPLGPGMKVSFQPNAQERVTLTASQPARLKLSASAQGQAELAFTVPSGNLALFHSRHFTPTPDPIASRAAKSDNTLPGPYGGLQVREDKASVTVSTPWWTVIHDKTRGGAITDLRYTNGNARNILVEPVATRLIAGRPYSDVADKTAKIEIIQNTPTLVKLRVTGRLMNGSDALCPFEHVYEYRPMLVRRTCRYDLGDRKIACTGLSVGSMTLQPTLDECAFRQEKERTTWSRAVFPGPTAFDEPSFSQYLCLFQRGVEGLDWLPAADLGQWQGFGGRAKSARYAILGDAMGHPQMLIQPLAEGSQPLELTGTLAFESYLSLPQVKRTLPRRNFVACLDNGQCTDDFLKFSADYGVTDIMLGAGNTPGTFKLSDLTSSQQSVRTATKYGMKIYPFDPFQLVHKSAEIWKNHEEWGREEVPGKLKVYSSYGDYFCPQAEGFRDALKTGYTQLVESASFTGLYHDFTHPYICASTRHYPTPHLNTDGVLDMILWDRNFLGPNRVFCGHTGWCPVLFFQDLSTVSAIFEEYPSTEPLPLHLTPAQGEFVNAAQFTLVSSFLYYGAAGPDAQEGVGSPPPPGLVDAYLARCALTGIFPWAHSGMVGATDMVDLPDKLRPWYRLFALRGSNDLGTMQFLPWHRQTAVRSSNPFVRAATYWNKDRAIVVLANSESGAEASFSITIQPDHFGWPKTSKLTLKPMKDCDPLTPSSAAFSGTLKPFGWSAYQVDH